jgi:hypothetical protein
MAIYIAPNNRKIPASELQLGKANDQVIFSGVNDKYLLDKGVFFLEFFEAKATTTVQIKDGQGTSIASGVTWFSNDQSPLRCDYGIEVVGEVTLLKGFIVRNVFES